MRVNKAMLMIRLVNRITAERDYWKEKVEAQLEGKPFVENERYERSGQVLPSSFVYLYHTIGSFRKYHPSGNMFVRHTKLFETYPNSIPDLYPVAHSFETLEVEHRGSDS